MIEVNIENLKKILKGQLAEKRELRRLADERGDEEAYSESFYESMILERMLKMISSSVRFNASYSRYAKEKENGREED